MHGVDAGLPYSQYTDPSLLAHEQRHVFGRGWLYVGHASQLCRDAAIEPLQLAHMPLLLVRDDGGTLRAFWNVCRHRGARMVDEARSTKSIQCPYHAWTYALDGTLTAAPRCPIESLAPERRALRQLRLEWWGPFAFANADDAAPPLLDALEHVPAQVAAAGIDVDVLEFHSRSEDDVAANWKLVLENYLECYHCQIAHPEFSAQIDVRPDAYELRAGTRVLSQYGTRRDAADDEPPGQFHFVWPGTIINVYPGAPNLSIGPVLPTKTGSTHRFLDYCFGPDVDPKWRDSLLDLDDQVGGEDLDLVARVQSGMESGLDDDTVLILPHEQLIGRFHELLAER